MTVKAHFGGLNGYFCLKLTHFPHQKLVCVIVITEDMIQLSLGIQI